MEKLQAFLAIPITIPKHGLTYIFKPKLSPLQLRIIIELSKRPCYLNMLSRKLNRPNNIILDSLRSLMRRNIIESTIYVSPEILDKAGVRRYYIIKNTRCGHSNRRPRKMIDEMKRIFVQDDENILKMRTYYKAMNMLQSPNPIKQSTARTILQKLDMNPHHEP